MIWKAFKGPLKEEYGEKMWKRGDSKLYFWQSAIYLSTAITFIIMYFLNWTNLVTF